MNLRHQRGVALLAAILLVALGTIIAAAIAFQSAMAARRGTASLSFDESVLVAQGAEALAAYALREDAKSATVDLSQGWTKTLGPIEIDPGVVLEASLEDLQGRFNLNGLIANDGKRGVVDQDNLNILRRLMEELKIEPKWANEIADWIDQNQDAMPLDGLEDNGTTGQNPPYRTANTFITSTSELLALPGFGRERFLKLAPYIVALPPEAKLNVCTAPGLLLDAIVGPGAQEWGIDEHLGENRTKKCVPTYSDFQNSVNTGPDGGKTELVNRLSRINEKSDYFRLTSLVTIGGNEFALYSLLKRELPGGGASANVRVLQRSFTPD